MINPHTGEALVQFPSEFIFKVTGKNTPEFAIEILQLIQTVRPDCTQSNIRFNYSKNEKYISLTIKVYVEQQADIDAIYQKLKDTPSVLWAL